MSKGVSGKDPGGDFTKKICWTMALILGLLGLERLPLAKTLPRLRSVVLEMANPSLNADDYHALAASYYEGIEDHARIAPGAENSDYVHRDDFMRYEFRPNVKRRYAAGMRITNSVGMANPEYRFEKPPHTRRIALLGDSVSVGPYGQGYEARLESRLNQASSTPETQNFQILNFSVPGYVLLQEMDLALEKAPKFHPDVYMVALTSQEILGSRGHIAKLILGGIDIKYDFLRKVTAQAGIQPTDRRSAITLKLAPFFVPMTRWSLEQIREHAAAHGGQMVIVLVPAAMDPNITAADFDLLHSACDGLGVPVIDLRDTFLNGNLKEFQVDPGPNLDIHPNARGHEMIFDNIYAKLQSNPEAWTAIVGKRAEGSRPGSASH
jgi:hypothetical protein